MTQNRPPAVYHKIYRVVSRIPKGRVATYGQVAALAGLPGRARLVGHALRVAADDRLPWHRVVNAKGEVSTRADGMGSESYQLELLRREGIPLNPRGRIDLDTHAWDPPPGTEFE